MVVKCATGLVHGILSFVKIGEKLSSTGQCGLWDFLVLCNMRKQGLNLRDLSSFNGLPAALHAGALHNLLTAADEKYRSLWYMSTTNHNILYFVDIPSI